jgi:hypothetical protein
MLPIDREAKKIEVKLARLVEREDAENRNGAGELDRHPLPLGCGIASLNHADAAL